MIDSSPFDWSAGYPSRRQPVFGRRVVATSHPLAAQAGLKMMWQGGNAADATVAAAAVMALVEPCSNGLGSDAFALVWDGQQLRGLNASGPAPSHWNSAYFLNRYGQGCRQVPQRGWDSVTIPGAVGGWWSLHQALGRLPWEQVLAPAIEVAQRGYAVPVIVQDKWARAARILGGQPGFAQAFLPKGRAPEVGERFVFEAAAKSLRLLQSQGVDAFYQGEIAQAMARHAKACGAPLSLKDLADYAPRWEQPLAAPVGEYTLHEMPPNGQGIAAQMALGILAHFDMASLPPDSLEATHLQIEAMKLAFADVYRWVADPAYMPVSAQALLDPDYLKQRSREIDRQRAKVHHTGRPEAGGTIYLSVADDDGMMVSWIQSNYMGFGSGVVVPDYGVSLQNRGHSFQVASDHPNQVGPGKRPFHTIIPAFLTQADRAVMSFGVMGGNMQPQGHMQTLVRMLMHKQNPQAACDAPRWRFNEGLSINVEPSMSRELVQGLIAMGHQVDGLEDSYQDFGAGQFIWSLGHPATDGYVAASDPRRDGQVAAD